MRFCADTKLPCPCLQARNPHLTIATGGGAKVESHPIILSPMSRAQSAAAPATPHSPPADAQLPGTAEEAAEESERSHQEEDAPPTPAPADAPLEPAADQEAEDGHGDAAAVDTADATEPPMPPAAGDAPTQAPGEGGEAQSAEVAAQQGGNDEGPAEAGDDSESDPSTPVAVREALAAVHSLAISTGANLLGSPCLRSLHFCSCQSDVHGRSGLVSDVAQGSRSRRAFLGQPGKGRRCSVQTGVRLHMSVLCFLGDGQHEVSTPIDAFSDAGVHVFEPTPDRDTSLSNPVCRLTFQVGFQVSSMRAWLHRGQVCVIKLNFVELREVYRVS